MAELKDNINTMIGNLRLTTDVNTEQDWLKTNLAKFTNMLQGQRDLTTVGRLLLTELTPLVNAHMGVIYRVENEENGQLRLLAAYAGDGNSPHPQIVQFGEGLIGQSAVDKRQRLVSDIPTDAVPISSALLRVAPKNLVVLPVLFENQVKAVIELSSVGSFTTSQMTFLEQLTDSIGIVLNSIEATMQTEGLLTQSQQLAGELQTQQKELQQTNEQLEQKAQQLAERNVEVERKNQEIEQARRALEEKATELSLTSKYKSEFLANMSHELRTPLNSILILGQQLTENPDGNLSAKQVEFARTIHGAGTDLLNLISDILDLSKIESGTVTVDAEEILTANLLETVGRPFRHEAENRHLSFEIEVDNNLGRSMVTDSKRLQQVLKNLLSNAFKFTAEGGVRMTVSGALGGWSAEHPLLNHATVVVAFEVSDTGIGIPLEKQKLIFEAFQQADAGTSRKYGGTGLGLAISRELASLLGGEIHLRSTPGKGSTFTLYLPLKYSGPTVAPRILQPSFHGATPVLQVATQERVDRTDSRRPPQSRAGRHHSPDRGRRPALCAGADRSGPRQGLQGADRQPRRGGAGSGKTVPADRGVARRVPARHARLDRAEPAQAQPADPAHSGPDHYARRGPPARAGARRVLLRQQADHDRRRQRGAVADQGIRQAAPQAAVDRGRQCRGTDEHQGTARSQGHRDRHHRYRRRGAVDLAEQALRLRRARPAAARHERLRGARPHPRRRTLSNVPVVVFTGRELSAEEDAELHTIARSIVVKGVESPERLLDETSLFLHRVITELPIEKQRMLEKLNSSDEDLVGRTALLVDDDARNIFALSSVLERRGMKVLTATTGGEAIALVESNPEIAIVLMDIMMPQMDGYQTMGLIRQNPSFSRLPIIALTAKAMKGDREKCLEAGASDYLAKPVNTEQLLLAIRMWLHR